MSKIKRLEIHRYKGIKHLLWDPCPGLNCLIGPGDSSKSTILEAIELGLGSKRNYQFSDADFHLLNVESPIVIDITIGDLEDSLKKLDSHGLYLRGFNDSTKTLEDEPSHGLDVVLTIRLTVNNDLEPIWTLYSERGEQSSPRQLNWSDRQTISPARIGNHMSHDLSWRKGSILNKISDEKATTSSSFAQANREARSAFGKEANEQLKNAREIVTATAKELGVSIGKEVQALLDLDSFSMNGGSISLHNESGVPLKNLGIGSTRMLIAGLQRKALSNNIILVDELEHGLEPHRIIRFLHSIGSKLKCPKQAFLTTHSPTALRELTGDQVFIVRPTPEKHFVQQVGVTDEAQSTLRLYPEAFLAKFIIICEGASEVGLVRGIDQYRTTQGQLSITANAFSWIDGGGGDKFLKKAIVFKNMGYVTTMLCDNDVPLDQNEINKYHKSGGFSYWWETGNCLEQQMFNDLDEESIKKLIDIAIEIYGEEFINSNISSASGGKYKISDLKSNFGTDKRILLASITKKKNGWFKSVTHMEAVAANVIGPQLHKTSKLNEILNNLFNWASNAK